MLAEKGLEFEMKVEKVWERRHDFLALDPTGEVPVLVEENGMVIANSVTIVEYLEECYPDLTLLGSDLRVRAEVRRLSQWFDLKFNREVTENLVGEKIMKRFLKLGEPDSNAIRAGTANIHVHLEYIGWLIERHRWLAGDELSVADISAAAHLSSVDYLGDVPWEDHDLAKDWYARIKSRPSFRSILGDHIPGCPPPPHYADLDF